MKQKRIAVITGAAGGLGMAVGRRAAARAFHLILVERSTELAEKAVAELGTGEAWACDLSDRDDVARFAEQLQEWGDELDVVYWNAGVIVPGDVVDLTPQQLDLQLDVMLTSVLHLSTAAAKSMVSKGRGHILATVSMGALMALPGSAAYSAAKAGVRAYFTALAGELRGTGVSVSGIYPSAVDTDMLRQEALHGGSTLNFLGKISTAEDVADAFEEALDRKMLEAYVPYGDSWTARIAQFWPWLLPRFRDRLEKLGEKGRLKYVEKISAKREA